MELHTWWLPWQGPGLEHLHLIEKADGIVVDGLILGIWEEIPFRVRYEIRCTPQWELRAVRVSLLSTPGSSLNLF